MYHYIKYSIIKLIYFIINLIYFKKFFFRNDFELKIHPYLNKNSLEDIQIRSLEKNFDDLSVKLPRISEELKIRIILKNGINLMTSTNYHLNIVQRKEDMII